MGGKYKGWEEAVGYGSMKLSARALGLEISFLALVLPSLLMLHVRL